MLTASSQNLRIENIVSKFLNQQIPIFNTTHSTNRIGINTQHRIRIRKKSSTSFDLSEIKNRIVENNRFTDRDKNEIIAETLCF